MAYHRRQGAQERAANSGDGRKQRSRGQAPRQGRSYEAGATPMTDGLELFQAHVLTAKYLREHGCTPDTPYVVVQVRRDGASFAVLEPSVALLAQFLATMT